MTEIKLSEDQQHFLNTYHYINLKEWRLEFLHSLSHHANRPTWFYVGNWRPSNKEDEGYGLRLKNLEENRYYYWPKSKKV